MSARRTALGGLVAAVLAALLVALLGAPSQAEPKKLLVSSSANGPFRSNLATPLFDGGQPFVPLDAATSTFYVKNNSRQTARATLAVVDREGGNEFEDALTFDVDIDGTTSSGTVTEIGDDGCTLVTTGPSIAPGAVQAIDVGLAVGDLQEQVGMDQAATLDFVVTLTQTGRNGQVEVCGEQAVAEPEVKGAQGNGEGNGEGDGTGGSTPGDQCERDVVVTVAGDPTCVPTVVEAGSDSPAYGVGDPRSAGTVTALAVLATGLGAALVLAATRRRRTTR